MERRRRRLEGRGRQATARTARAPPCRRPARPLHFGVPRLARVTSSSRRLRRKPAERQATCPGSFLPEVAAPGRQGPTPQRSFPSQEIPTGRNRPRRSTLHLGVVITIGLIRSYRLRIKASTRSCALAAARSLRICVPMIDPTNNYLRGQPRARAPRRRRPLHVRVGVPGT